MVCWGEGRARGRRRLVEGTPHNQAPVSAASRRLIQLVSIPGPALPEPGSSLTLSCLKHTHVAPTQFSTGIELEVCGGEVRGSEGWDFLLLLPRKTQIASSQDEVRKSVQNQASNQSSESDTDNKKKREIKRKLSVFYVT